jgi:hypothetical protein
MLEKEIELKNQARINAYKRKDFENLLSNYPEYD